MSALQLPPELSVYTVAGLRPQWLAWVEQVAGAGSAADADGSAVDQVDGAGLQLLVALQHSLAARGCALRLRGASRPLHDGCASVGLARWLDELQAPEAA